MKRFFYGWWIVLATFTLAFLGFGISVHTFGVFTSFLSSELEWSRGDITLGVTFQALGIMLASPFWGRRVDTADVKKVILSATFLCSLSFLALALFLKLWLFYLCYFLIGTSIPGMIQIPANTLVTRWFEKRRGLAMGLTWVGSGLGGAVMVPLCFYFINTLGIRGCYLLLALILLVVIASVTLILVKPSPEAVGMHPDGSIGIESGVLAATNSETADPRKLHLSQVLRNPVFWLLCIPNFLISLVMMGLQFNLFPFLVDQGVTPERASSYVSFALVLSVCGRVTGGYLLDRFQGKIIAMLFYSLILAGLLILLASDAWSAYLAFAVFFGLSTGVELDLMPYLTSEYFGTRNYGQIFSYIYIAFVAGAAVGPAMTGYLYDRMGSYSLVLTLFSAAALLSVFSIILLPHSESSPRANPEVLPKTE